jgi:hypothetical protein
MLENPVQHPLNLNASSLSRSASSNAATSGVAPCPHAPPFAPINTVTPTDTTPNHRRHILLRFAIARVLVNNRPAFPMPIASSRSFS